MNRRNATKLGGPALLVATAVGLFIAPHPARGRAAAAPTPPPSYVGSATCRGCHRGLHATAVAAWRSSGHALSMWPVSQPPAGGRVVADFSARAPFRKQQVAYVLGSGDHAQAYLDRNLRVLPGEWDRKAKAWKSRKVVEAKTQCLGCHTTGFQAAGGMWQEAGVGCEMCHGPGSAHLVSRDKRGSITSPRRLDPRKAAMVCGQCHSQGTAEHKVHAFPVGFRPGGDLDRFLSCTPRPWASTRNAQYNQLRAGGKGDHTHGAPCLTCHDPHGAPIRRKAGGSLPGRKLSHHRNATLPSRAVHSFAIV